ncbi:hypothetical protein [Hymenobacter sp. HDW8]|uniref:hypothetical protein n=1 Tax=Hymenobacter sp. HDW8 TaxID=2714932 RepID=UPI0014072DFC|nr:hypothetical protein [Hymenobacter sp. HDW8]QIL78361.1 hypothetical protein G7064_21335 [Hymenobacter sp. HDW8]
MDYVLDGYRLVRNEAVLRTERAEWERQIETVIGLKGQITHKHPLFPLSNDADLFEYFRASQQLLALYVRDDSRVVGVVQAVYRHSFRVLLLSPQGQWLAHDSFLFKRIKILEIGTDYLLSLQLLASSRQ